MWKNKNKLAQVQAKEANDAAKMEKPKLAYTPHGVTTEEHLEQHDEVIISWKAPEYIQHEKSKNWYIAAIIVGLLLIIMSIVTQNYTMTLALVVFAIVYPYVQTKHPPKEIEIKLTRMGIRVGKMFFPYTHVKAFWIVYHPPFVKTLNLQVHKRFTKDLVVQLNDQDPNVVREFLCTQVPEWEGKAEPITDMLVRLLKL